MGRMTSSTNTSKTMHTNLEKKVTELESQLAAKQESLNSAEDKLKASEENMALVINENDKQSAELTLFWNANEDIKAKLRDLEKRLAETEKGLTAKYRLIAIEVEYYKLAEYTNKVIEIFRTSSEY